MRACVSVLMLSSFLCAPLAGANPRAPVPVTAAVAQTDSAIDMEGYLRVSREAAQHRTTRRLSEAEFLRMSREPNTLVLDARSRQKYDELHVKGAVNLAFSDIAIESLACGFPD